MNNNKITAQTGDKVFVRGLQPFESVLKETQYTISAIRLISDILTGTKEDLLKDTYIKVGLTNEDMVNDSLAGIRIVSLSTGPNSIINIPENRFEIINENGLLYTQYGLAINLGTLPTDFNFSDLTQSLTDRIKNTLGLTPTITIAKLSREIRVSLEDHKNFNDLLQANITDPESPESQLVELRYKYQKLQEDFAKLTSVLKNMN